MEFKLVYEGKLKAKKDSKHQDDIRQELHPQLKRLWKENLALSWRFESAIADKVLKRANVSYLPIATTELNLLAEIDIIFLRPEPPGKLITQGGDIDNRLKNLFDALKVPDGNQAIVPPDGFLQEGEPFFCVLEEDSLISKISVTTGQLLKESSPEYVLLVMNINIKPVSVTMGNIGLL